MSSYWLLAGNQWDRCSDNGNIARYLHALPLTPENWDKVQVARAALEKEGTSIKSIENCLKCGMREAGLKDNGAEWQHVQALVFGRRPGPIFDLSRKEVLEVVGDPLDTIFGPRRS